MAGIYIHIPFCKQACTYCNFHFSTSLRYKNELLTALLEEIRLAAPGFLGTGQSGLSAHIIETIYIGGGTPSLLDKTDLARLMEGINEQFKVAADAEVTLEANPDNIEAATLLGWKDVGINRLSVGVQSFYEDDLKWMNRAHDSRQALKSLELVSTHFNNYSIDLIYGSPGLTDEKWKSNVDRAISFGVPHLSCYALTVEPKTPLQKLIAQHQSDDVDPDRQSAQLVLLMNWLREAGYEHYEISNFAKSEMRSRHNSSYWKGKPYLGLGPSAHSYDGSNRWWNVANNSIYIQSIGEGRIPSEKEELTPVQRSNEYIMISLRTMEGIDQRRLQDLLIQVSDDRVEGMAEWMARLGKYLDAGLMSVEGDHVRLTDEGKLLADGIAADLFIDA